MSGPLNTERRNLLKQLGRIQRRWMAGRFAAALLDILTASVLFLAAYATFDYFAALEEGARVAVNTLWILGATATLIVAGVSILRFSKADAARHADDREGAIE